jgi:hypothetical protein
VELAHGVGGRQDLPISLTSMVVGASLALVISFVALGARWRDPRLDVEARGGRPVPAWLRRLVDAPAWTWWWRAVGLALFGLFLLALLAGPDSADNPAPGMIYVVLWVGLIPLSLLFGPVWRTLNPLRTLHLLGSLALRRDPDAGLRPIPDRLGYWPAAAALFAFVWLELVAPDRATTRVITIAIAVYFVATAAGAIVYGARWFGRGDAFEVFSDFIGRLAPIGRRRTGEGTGELVWRSPLDGMSTLRPAPGIVTTVVIMLGSTLYDSVSNAPFWVRMVQESGLPPVLFGTAGLVAAIGLVLGAFAAAIWGAGRYAGIDGRAVTGEFAHSVVPIAVGYLIAHYYSLLVLEGQRTLALASDPLGRGSDWFGTAGLEPGTALVTPAGVANLQVTVIVLGHLIGTVLAHDRAVRLFPANRVLGAQLPLLALMVYYTVVGLLLLFAG